MPMASKSKSKAEEALEFLDDLDSFAAPGDPNAITKPKTKTPPPPPVAGGKRNEEEVFAFIDEVTQKSTEPTPKVAATIPRSGTPTVRKSTERVRLGGGPVAASSSTSSLHRTASTESYRTKTEGSQTPAPAAGARSVVDEQVKHLPKNLPIQNDQVRGWGESALVYGKKAQEYAKNAQLDKLSQDFKRVGLSTLTDILNVVAPPISEHEVIQVWLSHDMQGYEGVESLVYRSLTRILEQVEGGDLIVNRGNESKPKDDAPGGRQLNPVDGYESAVKLAQVEVESLAKSNKKVSSPSEVNNPTTYSNVYIRVQPFFNRFKISEGGSDKGSDASNKLQFLVYLFDPEHELTHTSVTQAVSATWIDIWDEYDWVEDLVADSLRLGVEVLGQDYVVSRMGWAKKSGEEGEAEEEDSSEEETSSEEGDPKTKKLADS
ncbi:hypothetical protein FA13DRAFT_984070 [Coprinellus micaceus]|uniref:Maintenance of telomere capping protein 1 n=1 Tax=Coprinellus micaceus TaxID=71717 RepID=A0A4Y7RV25_COPMI|nr:hypothetical protein FA13DRAFT_984070 [Coprinellus micaceus]